MQGVVFVSDFVACCQILSDFVRFCRMLPDFVRFCRMLSDFVECCQILSHVVRFCRILFPSKPVVRAMEVSHAARKDEFRQNPRSHSSRFYSIFLIPYTTVYFITPQGRFSTLDCWTAKRVQVPIGTSSESSLRDISDADFVDTGGTIPTGEISSVENRPRGRVRDTTCAEHDAARAAARSHNATKVPNNGHLEMGLQRWAPLF